MVCPIGTKLGSRLHVTGTNEMIDNAIYGPCNRVQITLTVLKCPLIGGALQKSDAKSERKRKYNIKPIRDFVFKK